MESFALCSMCVCVCLSHTLYHRGGFRRRAFVVGREISRQLTGESGKRAALFQNERKREKGAAEQ